FPQPDGPKKHTNAPSRTCREISDSAEAFAQPFSSHQPGHDIAASMRRNSPFIGPIVIQTLVTQS
ncbi:MAG: hypothetical protein ACI9DC_004553, partial [Gammaproteobacteria bacterium]